MAISGLYLNTKLILGTAIITATVGVRQGSPTSCLLFTLYVNELVRALKRKCDLDGFLSWLHCLLLMDDTVLLATSRQVAIQKAQVLIDYCKTSGMVINASKNKFQVVNGDTDSRSALCIGDTLIQNCSSYIDLGAVFSQDGSIETATKIHCQGKEKHVLKFIAFITKNTDCPFWVKKKVFEAALLTAVLYSCESWLSRSLAHVQSLYMTLVKVLLGVRKTTPNGLCLIELGYPTVAGRIRTMQSKLVTKLIEERKNMDSDPFNYVWPLCCREGTKAAKYIREIQATSDHTADDVARVKR